MNTNLDIVMKIVDFIKIFETAVSETADGESPNVMALVKAPTEVVEGVSGVEELPPNPGV